MFFTKTSFQLEMQWLKSETSKFDWTLDDVRMEKISSFLNSIGLILNSIEGHQTSLSIKREPVGL